MESTANSSDIEAIPVPFNLVGDPPETRGQEGRRSAGISRLTMIDDDEEVKSDEPGTLSTNSEPTTVRRVSKPYATKPTTQLSPPKARSKKKKKKSDNAKEVSSARVDQVRRSTRFRSRSRSRSSSRNGAHDEVICVTEVVASTSHAAGIRVLAHRLVPPGAGQKDDLVEKMTVSMIAATSTRSVRSMASPTGATAGTRRGRPSRRSRQVSRIRRQCLGWSRVVVPLWTHTVGLVLG
jgi:hypothetical protein